MRVTWKGVQIALAVVTSLWITCFHVSAAEPDGAQARDYVMAQVREWLLAEDFDHLEQKAKEFREGKVKFPDGQWKLAALYDGIEPNSKATSPAFWSKRLGIFEHWKAKYPDSITQRVAQAQALIAFGWNARGNDYGYKVPEKDFELFGERLQQARLILEEAAKLPEDCPERAHALQRVALGQGWPRAEYEALYEKAVAKEPTYYGYYFAKANYLLPRWYGEEDEWEAWALETARRDPVQGLSLYTRIAWANSGNYGQFFKDSGIEWPRMREGFRKMEELHPGSTWNLNSFANFAYVAKDTETVKELLGRIGDKPDLRAWEPGRYDEAKRSITPLDQLQKLEPMLVLPRQGDGFSNGIAFSPDGRKLAVAYGSGTAVVWQVPEGRKLWTIQDLPAPVSTVAWSPDGKLLAIGSGLGGEELTPGKVVVYETDTRQEKAVIDGWKGVVGKVEFTPDGKTLVMVGGVYQKKSEGKLWDATTGKVSPLGWPQEHSHHLEFLAVSPDGHQIALECGQAVNVWDLEKKTFTLTTKQYALPWVWGLAFSPDGKTLAAGTGPEFYGQDRTKPGRLVLWDTADWAERKPGITTPVGGMGPVAFSPDSKLLAGGGYEKSVRVWDVATGEVIATFLGHTRFIRNVTFSPNGALLASSSGDGTVRIWRTPGRSSNP